jgi:hypothetical protein
MTILQVQRTIQEYGLRMEKHEPEKAYIYGINLFFINVTHS